jgi:hypothetical protein
MALVGALRHFIFRTVDRKFQHDYLHQLKIFQELIFHKATFRIPFVEFLSENFQLSIYPT